MSRVCVGVVFGLVVVGYVNVCVIIGVVYVWWVVYGIVDGIV